MDKKIPRSTVKIVAVIIFIYGFLILFGSVYMLLHSGKIKGMLLPIEGKSLYVRLLASNYLFALDGLIAIAGAAGLFLLKRCGFYLTMIGIVMFWGISWLQTGGWSLRINSIIASAIILIYLLYQRKLFKSN